MPSSYDVLSAIEMRHVVPAIQVRRRMAERRDAAANIPSDRQALVRVPLVT
jgi:hypothetical protein